MILALEQTIADPDKILGSIDWLLKVLIDPHHLIIAALWCVGYLAKKIKRIPDDDIPIVLVVFAILFCESAFFGEWWALPRAMVYAWLALIGNRLYKRWIQSRIGDDDETVVTVSSPGHEDQSVKASSPAVITVEKPTTERKDS